MNGSIGKRPTAWRAERLFRVVVSLEGKDLGRLLRAERCGQGAKEKVLIRANQY